MDEQKIIFSNRFEKEKFEDYKTGLGTSNTITPDFSEADDFLKFIQKNRRSVPSKERIADKDKFIKTVYELSNSFEIDADLIEFAEVRGNREGLHSPDHISGQLPENHVLHNIFQWHNN